MELKDRAEFKAALESDKLTVVDFFATWCGPCKMLTPVVARVDEKLHGEVNFIKVDIDVFNDLASEYRIQSVPTLVYLKNGQEITRTVGYMDEDSLLAKVNSLK